jgi:NADH-quinone oxidoreductase subunit E
MTDKLNILSENVYRLIDKEVSKYPKNQKKSAVIASLAIAQRETGYISSDVEKEIAKYLDMPPISVHEVAKFYNMFNTKPKAKFKLVICTNLPCALKNARYSLECLKSNLGVEVGKESEDGLFSLHEGECFGACADAPVLLVNNDQMHSWMDEQRINDLIQTLKNSKEPGENTNGST